MEHRKGTPVTGIQEGPQTGQCVKRPTAAPIALAPENKCKLTRDHRMVNAAAGCALQSVAAGTGTDNYYLAGS